MEWKITLCRFALFVVSLSLLTACGSPTEAPPSGTDSFEEAQTSASSNETNDDLKHDLISSENAANIEIVAQLGRGDIQELVWSPDSQYLLAISTSGIWRYATPFDDSPYLLKDHQAPVAFSPSGNRVVSSHDGCIVLWDTRTPSVTTPLDCENQAELVRLVFDPTGSNLTGLYRGGIILQWEMETSTEKSVFQYDTPLLDITYRDDGTLLGITRDNSLIRVIDLDSEQTVAELIGHSQPPVSAFFSPNGAAVVSLGRPPDLGLHVWDTLTGEIRYIVQALKIAFSSDSKIFAVETPSPGVIQVLDGDTGQVQKELNSSYLGRPLTSLALSSDKTLLAAANSDGSLQLWHLPSQSSPTKIDSGFGTVSSAAWLDDGSVALGFPTGEVQIWNWASGEKLSALEMDSPDEVTQVANFFSDNARLLVVGYSAGGVRLWDLSTEQRLGFLPRFGAIDRIYALALDRQSGYAAYSASFQDSMFSEQRNTIRVAELTSRTAILDIDRLDEPPTAVALSPGGTYLAFTTDDAIRLWDVSQRIETASFQRPGSVATSLSYYPDGTQLASGWDNGLVIVWNPETQRETLRLQGHQGAVNSVAYNPAGNVLASAGEDGAVQLWNTETGKNVATLNGIEPVSSLAFSETGDRLLSTTETGFTYVWAIPVE